MQSQILLLLLHPAAAILVSLLIWKRSEKRLILLCAGLWLLTIGTFAMTFPMFTSTSHGQMGGFGLSDTSRYLASLGVLGHVLVMLAIVILAISVFRKKQPVESELI